jgi:hypothetical protein
MNLLHLTMLLVSLSVLGCRTPNVPAPKVTQCVILDRDECSCSDGSTNWIQSCYGYIATSPDDYEILRNHFQRVTERLEICLQNRRACQ